MIEKKNFITMADTIKQYFTGDVPKAFDILGINETVIDNMMDAFTMALSNEVDPLGLARLDENVVDCGDYICHWLFNEGEFEKLCPTASDLYDYIVNRYSQLKKED